MEKALLVGIEKNTTKETNYYIEELKNLCVANEIEVLEIITQNLKYPTNKYYIGSGKVEEIKSYIKALEPDLVIFDDELSPSQIRNLEEALEIKIIDRTLLILDIFAKRAKSRVSMLQVELAQSKYMLPRLIGYGKSLSRQKSGTGSKGPGEKKLELDRRILADNIHKINEELKVKQKERLIEKQNRKRQEIKLVSLCGYTNAGKSSLMNALIEASSKSEEKQVFEKDMLFATLETEVRKISLKNKQPFLLSDTVGFVSKLPHHLVEAFKSTLEELKDADLLLHVIDGSNNDYMKQVETTNEVLKSLELGDKPMIYVINKCDLFGT